MKPTLVIGLGNPLMGDDGVGWHVAQRLASDPALPDSVDVVTGGADLLRLIPLMEGRKRVVLVDAMQSDEPPGGIRVYDRALPAESSRANCHHLSVVDAVGLLRHVMPAAIVLVTVSILSAAVGTELSEGLAACLPSIVKRVLEQTEGPGLPALISDLRIL